MADVRSWIGRERGQTPLSGSSKRPIGDVWNRLRFFDLLVLSRSVCNLAESVAPDRNRLANGTLPAAQRCVRRRTRHPHRPLPARPSTWGTAGGSSRAPCVPFGLAEVVRTCRHRTRTTTTPVRRADTRMSQRKWLQHRCKLSRCLLNEQCLGNNVVKR